MSQEFTFQIQEFYSKVLWCTYTHSSEDRGSSVAQRLAKVSPWEELGVSL